MNQLLDQAREVKNLKEDIKHHNATLKQLKEKQEILEAGLYQALIDEDVQKLTIDNQTLYCRQEFYASMPDKERGFDWLRNEGLGDLIYETVNARTLSSAMKERLQNDEEVPDTVVKISTKEKIGMRKA